MSNLRVVWQPIATHNPPEGVILNTKIDDVGGIRNNQKLIKKGNLWWYPDMSMYVYYTPTHWLQVLR